MLTNSGNVLKQYLEQIEKAEEEIANVRVHIRDIFATAKGEGFDPKIMKKVLRIRKLTEAQRQEEEAVLDTYMVSIGMAGDPTV